MKRVLFISIYMLLSTCMFAQKHGYIRSDSAYKGCEIYPQNNAKSAKTCIASLNKNPQLTTFTPDQILAYGYGSTDYISMSIPSGSDSVKLFFLAIVKGDNPVYCLYEKTGTRFFILSKDKKLVELIKKNGKFKYQLADYFNASENVVPGIHTMFSKNGIIKCVKFLKEANLAKFSSSNAYLGTQQNELTVKQKRWLLAKPVVTFSGQSGITSQHFPLDLQAGLPSDWDKLEATSITYSLAADIPLIKYWPVTYHQEVCFNKFVSDYRQGSDPPDYQLIQDFSVISLPAMVRYTLGRQKFTGFIDAGVQLDISLNKNNVGWLIVGTGNEVSGPVTATPTYLDYPTVQPGITGGFGISYKLNKILALNVEFRYSSIFSVLPGKAGIESLYSLKAGITYNIFKKQINP